MVGQASRALKEIQAEVDRKIDEAKREAALRARIHEKSFERDLNRLFVYAAANREKLTRGGRRKTVRLSTGKLYWRFTPPALFIKNKNQLLRTLDRSEKLRRFIRIIARVDVDLLRRHPEIVSGLPGVRLTRREEFVVKPNKADGFALDASRFKRSSGRMPV